MHSSPKHADLAQADGGNK